MRRADLLRGDRPWRIELHTDPRRPQKPLEAVYGTAALVTAVLLLVAAPGLGGAVAACLAWWWFRPTGWLTGGGREAMSSTEWLEWNAHLALSAAEREHAQREAEAKARRR